MNKEKLRVYKREYARAARARIKANPVKYAEYKRKSAVWSANARARRTPAQREAIRLGNLRWRTNNRDRYRKTQLEYRRRLKELVVQQYGGVCACCGEKKVEFLAIDHIEGGGNKHRQSLGIGCGQVFYHWLRKNGYPEGYRVLCHNCNQARGHFGYCPHEVRKEQIAA